MENMREMVQWKLWRMWKHDVHESVLGEEYMHEMAT